MDWQENPTPLYSFGKTLHPEVVTLKVLVATIDAQWEGMGDVGFFRN